jgi:hypothetical protein
MNIGRPKGYVEPPAGAAPASTGLQQQLLTQHAAQQPTTVLLLTNPLPAGELRVADDCRIVSACMPPSLYVSLSSAMGQ